MKNKPQTLAVLLEDQMRPFWSEYNVIKAEEADILRHQLAKAISEGIVTENNSKIGMIPFIVCVPKERIKNSDLLSKIDIGSGIGTGQLFLDEKYIVDTVTVPSDKPWLRFNIHILGHMVPKRETIYHRQHHVNEITGVTGSFTFQETLCLLHYYPEILQGDRCGIHIGDSIYKNDAMPYFLHAYRLGSGEHARIKVAREKDFIFDLRYIYPEGTYYFLD